MLIESLESHLSGQQIIEYLLVDTLWRPDYVKITTIRKNILHAPDTVAENCMLMYEHVCTHSAKLFQLMEFHISPQRVNRLDVTDEPNVAWILSRTGCYKRHPLTERFRMII